MNTTKNQNITKLKEASEKRNEAWTELNKYVNLQQHNLPQEIIDAWGGLERLELEARTIEAEAINGIEQGLDILKNSNNEEKKTLGLSDRVLRKMLAISFMFLISHLIMIYVFEIPEPKPVNSSFEDIPSGGVKSLRLNSEFRLVIFPKGCRNSQNS